MNETCRECKKPFHTLYAGRDDDYIGLLEDFIDFAFQKDYTDRYTVNSAKSWLKRAKARLDFPDKLRRMIKEAKP